MLALAPIVCQQKLIGKLSEGTERADSDSFYREENGEKQLKGNRNQMVKPQAS